jgi:hypothetical protein
MKEFDDRIKCNVKEGRVKEDDRVLILNTLVKNSNIYSIGEH